MNKLKSEATAQGIQKVAEERRKVDDYLVTTNITLVGAFVVLLALNQAPGLWVGIISAASLSLLVVSLTSLLWHRYRHPIREMRWEEQRADISWELAGKVVAFHQSFVDTNPQARNAVAEGVAKVKKGEEPSDPHYLQVREVVVAILRSQAEDTERARRRVFEAPMDESGGKVLHLLDISARKLRYIAFVLGIMLFVVAAVLSIIGKA